MTSYRIIKGLALSLLMSALSIAHASAVRAQGQTEKATRQTGKFGAWVVECVQDTKLKPNCQVTHRSVSPDGKQTTLVFSLAKINDKDAVIQLALPLGFAIQAGVQLQVGSTYSTTATVSRCTMQGCIVEGPAPAELLSAMLKEKSGKITVRSMQGESADLPLDLDGFSDAYAKLN